MTLRILKKWLLSIPEILNQTDNRPSKTIRLNIGVGPHPINKTTKDLMKSYGKGWVYIDKYIIQPKTLNYDGRNLPYKKNQIDTILSSHLLEHIPAQEIYPTLKHWHNLLKPKGQIYLNVPDLEWMCQRFIDLEKSPTKFKREYFNQAINYKNTKHSMLSALYGSHEHQGEIHHTGFTQKSLKTLLKDLGFINIKIQKIFEDHSVGCLIATAIKP